MVIFLQARCRDWTTIPAVCSRFSYWPISIHNRSYIFHLAFSEPYSGVLHSEKFETKKLSGCYKMFAFLKAIFKFCTTKRLFKFFKPRFNKQEIEDLDKLIKFICYCIAPEGSLGQ